MGLENTNKLKRLLSTWAPNTVATSNWLSSQGISPQLAKKYVSSGWMDTIGQGAFKKLNEPISWQGGVYALQEHIKLPVHVGGLTALSYHGVSHYLRLAKETIFLFTSPMVNLPKWFEDYAWDKSIVVLRTGFLNERTGINVYQDHGIAIRFSNIERAILEALYLAPKHFDIIECYKIIEGLHNLRPAVQQQLLEECNSIKVKRLFLFMAEKANLPVIKHLDLQRIYLGRGDRSIVDQGSYDGKYGLILPKELIKSERSI
jgi:hypothetical protein